MVIKIELRESIKYKMDSLFFEKCFVKYRIEFWMKTKVKKTN